MRYRIAHFSWVTVILLAFFLLSSTVILGAVAEKVTLSTTATGGVVGEEIDIPIAVDTIGIKNFDIPLIYDPAKLEPVSINAGPVISGFTTLQNLSWEPDTVYINGYSLNGTTTTGVIATFRFKVLAAGETTISLDMDYAMFGDGDVNINGVNPFSKTLTNTKVLGNDASVSSVIVDGVVATVVDETEPTVYNVELPAGTVLTALTPADIEVTATDTNASVGAATPDDEGATWTVVVTAEDGTTTQTYTINVTVAPTPATWSATGAVGINADKVYAGYQLMDETEQIPLTDANITSIKVLNPDSTTTPLTPDEDPLLWFNVEKAAGEYVYTIVTEGGITYSATLTWQAPMTAIWSETGAEDEAPHNGYLYKEYQLMYSGNPISLAVGEVDLIAFKDEGNWKELEPNADTTLWFDKSKPTGNYEYLIANADGIYKATLTWTESPVLVTSINVSGAGGATTMKDRLAEGQLQMVAVVLPANAANKEVTWSVAPKGPAWSEVDPGQIGAGFAEIRADGLLYRGHTVGPVTVRATAKDGSGIYGETDITIVGVHMSIGGVNMIVDNTHQLTAQAVPADTTEFTWASSNEEVAIVSSIGLVKAVSPGTATVTATTADGRVGSCSIAVQPKPPATMADLTISEGTLTPAFDPNIYEYTATVANSIKSVTISATKWRDMDVSGDIGTFDLLVGPNTFEIYVDGGAGHVDSTYTVVITRKSASGGGGGGGGVVAPTVTGVAIKDAPDKVAYTEGDALDLSGLIVTLTYSNGTTKDIALANFADNKITVSPKAGDVLDAGDKEIVITVNGKTAKQAITVNKKDTVTPPVEEPVLTDIDGHWAQANIEYLVGIGAVAGYPDETFRPDSLITRAEFAKIIVDAFELTAESGKIFADTADHWAKDYVAIAAANGIVLGYNDQEFGPDDLITREQMAIMIVKAAGLTEATGELSFTDKDEVSSWAYDWVVSATQNKIMSGYTDNTFKPLNNATRAEAATVIYNVLMK